MEVVTCDNARRFRTLADPLLLENEAKNNLILGVTGILVEDPMAFDRFHSWVVMSDGEPVAAGAVAGPNNLILGEARSKQAVIRLAGATEGIRGVVGTVPWVDMFVAFRPEAARRTMRQGVFELRQVTPPTNVTGHSRMARATDIDVLCDWFLAFQEEAIGHVEDAAGVRNRVVARIETQTPTFGTWVHEVDDELVAMSSHSGPTPSGIRLGAVYTPPHHRRHGYATAVVAAQSQWLLDSGHRFCFLYTDLANPTSNAIYRSIGYRQIAESAEYAFT
ncbi:MAG: GNAT family N-acetyltransferase [Acidimicrobiia bacterium]